MNARWTVARSSRGCWWAITPDRLAYLFSTWREALDYADRMARADR